MGGNSYKRLDEEMGMAVSGPSAEVVTYGVHSARGTNEADTIDGGDRMTLTGLGGNDSYFINSYRVEIVEAVGGGRDTLFLNTGYFYLNSGAEIEVIRATDGAATNSHLIYGNEFRQLIAGAAGNDTINGGGGADTMEGRGGDDTYYVDNASDIVSEQLYGGTDTIIASVSYTVPDFRYTNEIEFLRTIDETATTAINLGAETWRGTTITGNAGTNVITGGYYSNLYGLGGNDTYVAASYGVSVYEAVDGGTDTVIVTSGYFIAYSGQEIEVLRLRSTGETRGTTIYGNEFAQVLSGGAGNDMLAGNGGNDTYFVTNGDTVSENVGNGRDRVNTSNGFTLAEGAEIEILAATERNATTEMYLGGNEFAQLIVGNNGQNGIDGGGGADTMEGLGGNDTYFVDHAGDRVIEGAGGGSDTVLAVVSHALAAGQQIEFLTAIGNPDAQLTLRGNEFAQTISGNAAANSIFGGVGDTLIGRGGNDSYFIESSSVTITEAISGGVDRIFTASSFALGAGSEIETLSARNAAGTEALVLTGNEFNQLIIGNAGANTLNGAGGADTMEGRGGNDVYRVDNAGDRVIEGADGGIDTVISSVDFVLGGNQHVETIRAAEGTAAINLTGNERGQTLVGNAGSNILNGMAGADSMIGNGGNDFYIVDNAADMVFEARDGGTDRVNTSVSYRLGEGQSIEVFTAIPSSSTQAIALTGNDVSQTISGNNGANVIAGRGGNDILSGLGGADSFLFDTAPNAVSNRGLITDYNVADDSIHLDDAIFTQLAAGGLHGDHFVTGSAAVDASDRIIYNSGTGALSYDADGSGSGAAVQFATLSAGLAITASDFLVV